MCFYSYRLTSLSSLSSRLLFILIWMFAVINYKWNILQKLWLSSSSGLPYSSEKKFFRAHYLDVCDAVVHIESRNSEEKY